MGKTTTKKKNTKTAGKKRQYTKRNKKFWKNRGTGL